MHFRHAAYATVLALLVAGCDGAGPTASDTPVDGGIRAGRSGQPGPVGTITVVLNVHPDDPQDFSIALTGQKRATLLDDDNDPTLPNMRKYPSLAAGSYTLAIGAVPAGYKLIDVTCTFSSGSNAAPSVVTGTAPITLATGGQVTCTFTVFVDKTLPTVTIDQAAGQPDPTASTLVSFTAVFSKSVSGFAAADVSVTNGSVTSINGSGATYTVAVTAAADGAVTATIPASGVTDIFGNLNAASTSTDNSVTVDRTGPTVTAIPDESNGFDQGCSGSFTVQFSEAVTGFTTSDVSLAGSDVAGLSVAQVTGGPSTYTVTVAWGVGSTIVMSVPANAATSVATDKPNVASSNTNNHASISSACAPIGG